VITRVYWFVCSRLVRSFVRDARCNFSKNARPIFIKFRSDVQYLCQI